MNALRFQDLPVCDTTLAYMLQMFQAALCPLYKWQNISYLNLGL